MDFGAWAQAAGGKKLAKAEAAVDGEDLAGDELSCGGEEEDSLSDVVCGAVAAHGSFGGETCCLKFDSSVGFRSGASLDL